MACMGGAPARLWRLEAQTLRSIRRSTALSIFLAFFAVAQGADVQDSFLDRMVGKWVLEGMIAGKKTTHDIAAEWVLGHQYLRIQEVSREKNAKNQPAYEATVLIGLDPQTKEYRCLWLDNTGPWDFTAEGIGRAKRGGDSVTFRFGSSDSSSINTTFTYDRSSGAWRWSIDNETGGKVRAFARVRLTRK